MVGTTDTRKNAGLNTIEASPHRTPDGGACTRRELSAAKRTLGQAPAYAVMFLFVKKNNMGGYQDG